MKAQFNPSKAKNFVSKYREIGERNGMIYGLKAVAIDGGEHGYERLIDVADIRLYCPKYTVYACAWIRGNGHSLNGTGKAGGYGYDKRSAAIESALIACGISFDVHWGASGRENTIEAVKAACALVGFPNVHIIEVHP